MQDARHYALHAGRSAMQASYHLLSMVVALLALAAVGAQHASRRLREYSMARRLRADRALADEGESTRAEKPRSIVIRIG